MFTKGQDFGKYRIEDVLGSGGFGAVYLALDRMIEKKVALKVPHEQTGDIEKLLKEARLLARLEHPHIIRVYTADIIDGTFFIVMEYVEGETLMERIKNGRRLSVEDSAAILQPVGEAVEYAHRQQIIHRDIRPSNVLMERRTNAPKVADFGTSRMLETAAPFAKTRIGSPPYMPPEQFDGRATFASDVYALGVMAYRLMCGKLPFFHSSLPELERLIKREAAVALNLQERSVPKRVSDVVMRAIEKDTGKRYQSVAEFLSEMSAAMDREYKTPEIEDIRARIRAREQPRSIVCWNCRKPLPAQTKSCPHCRVTV
jgi:serine/threonine-protein kinase